jgi:hypothetical protein
MKSFIVITALVVLSSFYSKQKFAEVAPNRTDTISPTKPYCVQLQYNGWATFSASLDYIKSQLRQTDLSSKTVSMMIDSLIAPFQNEMAKQINRQIAADTLPKPKK